MNNPFLVQHMASLATQSPTTTPRAHTHHRRLGLARLARESWWFCSIF